MSLTSRTDDSAIDMELSQLSDVPEEEIPEPAERDTLMSYDDIEVEMPVPRELEMPGTPRIPRKSFADIRDIPGSTSTPAPVNVNQSNDEKSRQSSQMENANGKAEINLSSPGTSDDSKEHPCDECEEIGPKSRGQFGLFLAVIGLSVLVGFLAGYFIREEKFRLAHHSQNEVCVVSSFPTSLTSSQLQYQDQAVGNTSKDRLQEYARMMSQSQCMSGTPCSQNLTNQLVNKLKGMGFPKVEVSTYKVLVSLPDMTRPSTLKTMDGDGNVMDTVILYGGDVANSTNEKLSSGDVNSPGGINKRATSEDPLTVASMPMYVPYSSSGTAEGELVYVNCGSTSDFNTMKDMGIETKGKIAISKQCDMMTMQQVKNVEEQGMLGLILYTDPADMNSSKMRSGIDVSMGMSGMYGDPLTPGCPAKDGIHRMSNMSDVLPTIPVQTVTTNVAMMLLSNMLSSAADWHGGLNITYHVGKNYSKPLWTVELDVHNTMEQQDIHNIMVTIPGTDNPDQYVMMGGHYTTSMTTMMSEDMMMSTATGSTSMMMEVATGLADLLEDGWEPTRTVMLGLWEGADMGNSGSMEWVEEHRMAVADRSVAYIDLDTTMGDGTMVTAEASPLLNGVVMDAADQLELTDVVTMTTLDGMGDHVPFSHMLGVPSVSFHTTMKEPGSSPVQDLDVSTTMLATKTLLLLADDPIIRYDGLSLAEMVTDYVDSLTTQLTANKMTVNNITMGYMEEAATQYMQAVQMLQSMVDDLETTEDPVTMTMINDRLMYMEKAFVMDGSSGTMRHILYGSNQMETFSVMIDAMSEDSVTMETVEEMLSVVQCVLQSATTSLTLS